MEKEKTLPEESSGSEEEKPKKSRVKAEKEDEPVVRESRITKVAKSTQQSSYIMKLFDRSVNLAKFNESTPLYPLCRSWMQNAPRQFTAKSEKNADPESSPALEEGDVGEMPKVRVRKGGKPLVTRKDVKINNTELDKTIDSEIWTKEKLLEFHRTRWEEERQKHIDNSRNFEDKHFSANLELLESLFKGNEE